MLPTTLRCKNNYISNFPTLVLWPLETKVAQLCSFRDSHTELNLFFGTVNQFLQSMQRSEWTCIMEVTIFGVKLPFDGTSISSSLCSAIESSLSLSSLSICRRQTLKPRCQGQYARPDLGLSSFDLCQEPSQSHLTQLES